MGPNFVDINWWAVLVAAMSAFLLGGLWYVPLFRTPGTQNGIDPDAPPPGASRLHLRHAFVAALVRPPPSPSSCAPIRRCSSPPMPASLTGLACVAMSFGINYASPAAAGLADRRRLPHPQFTLYGVILGFWHLIRRAAMPLCHMRPPRFGFGASVRGRENEMRIGIVVDSVCDVPTDFIERENVTILPVTVQIGQAVLADHRDGKQRSTSPHDHVAKHGIDAETTPFTVQQVHDLFISQLVLDYDHVFCITTTRTRSGIHDNAQQASYHPQRLHPVRQAAGNNTPFSLRVIDSQNVFAAVGVLAIEAARLARGRRGAAEDPRTPRKASPRTCRATMVPPT